MTLSHPGLRYLSECEYMEMRPALEEEDPDELFEMVASQTLTYCDRDYTSHDLVVVDASFGIPRFCIKGAEVPRHKVQVYVRMEDRIGEIKNNQIILDEASEHVAITQRDANTYSIDSNTSVTFGDGLVTFRWDRTVSVELKVMVIAFAIQLALTSEAERVIDKPQSTDAYDSAFEKIYTDGGVTALASDCKYAAKPIENKIIGDPFFHCRGNQRLILKPISWLWYAKGALTAFMNHVAQPQIMLLAKTHYQENALHVTAFDADNTKHFSAIGTKKGQYAVRVNSVHIGEIVHDLQARTATLTSEDNGDVTNMTAHTIAHDEKFPFRLVYHNMQGDMLASAVEDRATIVNIEVNANVSAVTKKVIFASILIYGWNVLKIYSSLPRINVSSVFCGCSTCRVPCIPSNYIPMTLRNAQPRPLIRIRPSGYNRRRNLVYLDAYNETGRAIITLECTPEAGLRGFAKIVGRNGVGKLIFTTLNIVDHDMFAVYNRVDKLIGYQHETMLLSVDKAPIFHTTEYQYTTSTQGGVHRLGKPCLYRVYSYRTPENPKKYAVIRSYLNTLEILAGDDCTQQQTSPNNLACLLSLAAKIHSYSYGLDSLPLPEIDYRYQGADDDCEKLAQ